MSRRARILVFALVAVVAMASALSTAAAAPANSPDDVLARLWTTVLETPSSQNSFGSGGQAYACWDLDGTVAPFTPAPKGVGSCTVAAGTPLFIVGSSFECSSFEGNGTTYGELRKCATDADSASAPVVTVDGNPVSVSAMTTPLLHIVLPEDNLFGLAPGMEGVSVAHGWVALLPPLPPGVHRVVIGDTITTKIKVVA